MKRNQIKRAGTAIKSVLAGLLLAVSLPGFAQSCPVNPPPMDVLLFLDNSGSITTVEFDAAQQAIAQIATNVLSRPGYRLAVVNWACTEAGTIDSSRDGCRIDLATGSAIPGGWSSNPADFAYVGSNNPANRVCRSFGALSSGFGERNACGGANFTVLVNNDYAQHALKVLEGAMYSGGGTGGTDSNGVATVAPVAPSNPLMVIHMTDADSGTSSRIREVPVAEAALGDYYYSNRFKNVRNALMVGVGIEATTNSTGARNQLGAFSSRGGASTNYDTVHQTAPSTAATDIGTPRLATFSATYNAAQILAATTSALNATIPACAVMRKQSVGGVGSFNFTGGTNGLPSSLTLTTAAANTPVASPAYTLSGFNTDTGIQETIPSGWAMSGASCVNASNASVPVNVNTSTGQVTIPGAQITAGAQLTCTVTNTRMPPNFGTCDARMFFDSTNGTFNSSQLYNINTATSPMTFSALGSASSIARNGLGYHPTTNYLYTIQWGTNNLIRLDSNGVGTTLGAVSGLPTGAFSYSNGVIAPNGDFYVKQNTGQLQYLYRINIATLTATQITLNSGITTADLAWYGGNLYAINNGSLVRIAITGATGAVTTIGPTGISGLITPHSMWGFTNGIFAYHNSAIYAIDPLTGAGTRVSGSTAAANGDGANCASASIAFDADLSVTKTNTPASGPNDLPTDNYLPGETRTYSIVVTNNGPFGAQNITVSDPIPAGITASTVSWTCASTSGGAVCGAASGTGALNDTGLDLPAGAVATYRVTLTVPATFTGDLSNTVTITPPSTITDTNPANNTATDVDQSGQPNFGTCDARMFLSQSPNISTNTTLYNINTSANPLTFPAIGQGSLVYNSTAYNPQDNYIYAINAPGYSGNRLIRIGMDGSTVDLGVVTGLPVSEFNAGDIAPDGTYYVYAGSPGSGTLYAINIATMTATTRSLSPGTQASDLAWIGGLLYTVDTSGQLKSINPGTGTVTNIGTPSGAITLGALFGAPNGLFGSANGGGFYQINLLTGARTLISGSPTSSFIDGAHCATADISFAADLAITKTDGNTTYTPGTNVVYTIVVSNNGPFGAQNARVQDALPAGITTASWTCTAANGAVCQTTSGTGAIDARVDLPFNTAGAGATATFTLTMAVPSSFTGDLVNTATVEVAAGNTDPVPGNNSATDTSTQSSQSNLAITKTSTSSPVTAGGTITYSIVVTNNGPSAANNAVVSDDWTTQPGLDCSASAVPPGTATCAASGTAGTQCPAPASVTPAGLQAGLAIPALPNGGIVTFTLQCAVTATGQ